MTELPASPVDPLEQLLHRCRREELLPLARLARVDTSLGLSDLARLTARFTRFHASHGVSNLWRRGEGRPYPAILAEAAAILKVEVQADPELTELAVLRRWFVLRWEGQTPEARAILWSRMGLGTDAPADGEGAAVEAERRLGRGFGYWISEQRDRLRKSLGWIAVGLGFTPIGCALRPVLMPWMIWTLLRPPPEKLVEMVVEIARLRQMVKRRVTIGVVGSPSSGKDSAIRALFGIETGNISPVAGSTKEVSIQRMPGATALYVVNTPGLGDVVEAVTEEARQVLDHIDLYLYVVNAEGGVQAREKADHSRCVATGKPVMALVNKVDVLRARDRDRYLSDARAKLGVEEENFAAVAFDPLPELAPGPINLETVHRWLRQKLGELGKDPEELPELPAVTPRTPESETA